MVPLALQHQESLLRLEPVVQAAQILPKIE